MSDKLITEEIIDDTLSIEKVESDRTGALGENKEIYYGTDGNGGLIGDTTAAYDKAGSQFVIDPDDGFESASEMQIANQNASYQQTVNEIGQAKEQAQKDYTKEQTGSYVDYMKGVDAFGANAEQMAAMGLSRSGYNENSQVQAYVAYQNRVAVARESFNKIMLEYSNQMERARIANDSAIAQIYANSAQQLAALEIEKVAAVGQLVGQYQSAGNQINTRYDNLWKDTFDVMLQNRNNIESTILTTGVIPSDEKLAAAGMTREEAEALQGRYQNEIANEQTTATNNAQKHILDLIQSGAKPTAEQIAAAGWTQEYVDSLNELYNPTIKKSQDITANVDAYLAQGDLSGAITYAENNKGEISTEEYQALYYNIALNSDVDASTIETCIDTITEWKNSGKLSATDARSLEAYYYSQLGTSSDKAGIKLERINEGRYPGLVNPADYTYKGRQYFVKNKEIESNTVSILNGIATGSGKKTPAHGTIVMYNGKLYAYDSHTLPSGFLNLGMTTATKWKPIEIDSVNIGSNTVADELTKYFNTHKTATPEHSNNSTTKPHDDLKYSKYVDLQRR